MKHSSHGADGLRASACDSAAESVISGADMLGVTVSYEQACVLIGHLDLVLSANERQNLTRITDRSTAVLSHIVDSLAAVSHLRGVPDGETIGDLGSGAGFPGIPLATVLPNPLILIESSRKKAAFLQEVCGSLGLAGRVRVYEGRAEELGTKSGASCGAVTARAVSSLASLAELASPLLLNGGILVALKGSPEEAEFEAAARVAHLVGLEEEIRHEYTLPVLQHARTIVVYRKVCESQVPLPRRTGLAQHRPLG